MTKRKYTDGQFIEAVANSTSIRQVLGKLGLAMQGGNYASFHNIVKELNIDTNHFTGQGWKKDKTFGPRASLDDYFSGKQTVKSHKLRLRLLREGIFEYKCYKCNLSSWNNQPIPLELEHIDGDHLNNSLANLTILCPNCHAQTSTYRGKNKRKN